MKSLILQYVTSKMSIENEVVFRNGMVALGFTPQEAATLLLEIHFRLNR